MTYSELGLGCSTDEKGHTPDTRTCTHAELVSILRHIIAGSHTLADINRDTKRPRSSPSLSDALRIMNRSLGKDLGPANVIVRGQPTKSRVVLTLDQTTPRGRKSILKQNRNEKRYDTVYYISISLRKAEITTCVIYADQAVQWKGYPYGVLAGMY